MIRVLRGGNIDEGRWSVKDDDVMISSKYVREELLLKRGTFITPAVTSLERMAKTALIETDLYGYCCWRVCLDAEAVLQTRCDSWLFESPLPDNILQAVLHRYNEQIWTNFL